MFKNVPSALALTPSALGRSVAGFSCSLVGLAESLATWPPFPRLSSGPSAPNDF